MILEASDSMRAYLRHHNDFGECVLEEVRWEHFGTVIVLVFDYVWDDDGAIRASLNVPLLKTLRFHNVQELHVLNALSEHLSLHPSEVNWGLSEVAAVQLVDDPEVLARYQSLPIPLHHLRCSWEGERHIDIVFSTLEVL